MGQDYLGTWKLTSSRINKRNKQYINICCKDSYKRLYIFVDSSQNYTGYESGNEKIIFNEGKKLIKIPNMYYDTIASLKGDTLTILDAENYINVYNSIPHKIHDSLIVLITPRYANYNEGLVITNSLHNSKKIMEMETCNG